MTKKKLVLSTETLRLLSERDAEGVHGGSVTVSVTPSQHTHYNIVCAQNLAGPAPHTGACRA